MHLREISGDKTMNEKQEKPATARPMTELGDSLSIDDRMAIGEAVARALGEGNYAGPDMVAKGLPDAARGPVYAALGVALIKVAEDSTSGPGEGYRRLAEHFFKESGYSVEKRD